MRVLVAIGASLAVVGGVLTAVPVAAAPLPAHMPALPFDFNGDGYVDMAIGAPGEDAPDPCCGSSHGVGAVHVVYGGPHGTTTHGVVLRGTHSDSQFGATFASADIDADGYADLAVGDPYDSDIVIFRGSRQGLPSDSTDDYGYAWNNDPLGSSANPTDSQARFGSALAFGDFNNDGYADLAAGAPDLPVSHPPTASPSKTSGAVVIRYGSAQGFTNDYPEEWDAVNTGHASDKDHGEFGAALAALPRAGGGDDLVIGWPDRDAGHVDGGVEGAGVIEVLHGSAQGLDGANSQMISLDSPGVAGQPQRRPMYVEDCGYTQLFDEFGAALATGDFNGDGAADLAVGIPERQVIRAPETSDGHPVYSARGAVVVLYGSGSAFPAASRFVNLDQPGVPGHADREWYFGAALAAADINGDSVDDLAIGAPARSAPADPTAASDGGLVLVAPGSHGGLRPARGFLLREGHRGVPGHDVPGDLFGSHVMFWDSSAPHSDRLLVGAPGRTVRSARTAGAVVEIPRIAGQLRPGDSSIITGMSPGVGGSNSTLDAFGHLDGHGYLDTEYDAYSGEPRSYDNC